jgi:tetratricopeptide (TPR) repeat protein
MIGKSSSVSLAILLATCTLLLHSEDVATRLQRGLAMAQKGNCEAALVDLRALVALDPGNEPALTTIGLCETQLGHPERATDSFQRLVSIAPGSWQAWSNLGANHLTLNHPDLAVSALRKATKLQPGAASIWFSLGQAIELQGKDEEAFQTLDRANQLNDKDLRINTAWQRVAAKLATKAADQIENKDYQGAKRILLEVRRPLEKSASWNNLLGYAEFKLGDQEPALEHLQKALRVEPNSEDFLLDLGEYLLSNRADDAARKVYQEGLRRNPNSLRIQFGLAITYQAEKRHDMAIPLFKALIDSHPQFEPAYSALGRSFEKTLQWEGMIDLGKKLGSVNKSSALASYLVGSGLLGLDAHNHSDLGDAKSMLQKSLRLDPDSSSAHFSLAKAYEEEGNNDEAIVELEQTLRLAPQHEKAHYVLAQLYRKMGKAELANKELKAHEAVLRLKRDDSIRLLVTEAKAR